MIVPVAAVYHWLADGTCKAEALYGEADVSALREMLLRLEWAARETDASNCEYACCPECGTLQCENIGKPTSHEVRCALAALLERIR